MNQAAKVASVAPSDSLAKVAHTQLGDFSKWREVADFNGLNIFQALPTGTPLKIPSAADLESLAKAQVQQALGSSLDLGAIAKGRFYPNLAQAQPWKLIDWLY